MLTKSRWLITGIITGILLSVVTSGLAESYKYIRAVMDNSVVLSFDGEEETREDINVLIYEDRIYLPLRYLGEKLGAEIEWNGEIRRVEVKTNKENEHSKEKLNTDSSDLEESNENGTIDQESESTTNKTMYTNLPITKYASQALVQVREISVSDEVTVVSVEVNNQGKAPMQLDQQSSKLIVDNKEYLFEDLSNNILYKYDNAWFTDIYEEEKREGIIRLPKIPSDAKYADLHLKVLQNDGSGKEYLLVYHIKLN